MLGWVRAEFGTVLLRGTTWNQAWPVAHEFGLALAEENLRAIWRTYRRAGQARLIYTNTAQLEVTC